MSEQPNPTPLEQTVPYLKCFLTILIISTVIGIIYILISMAQLQNMMEQYG